MSIKNRISNDEFLSRLGKLFEDTESKSSVFLQQKRYAPSDSVEGSSVPTSSLKDTLQDTLQVSDEANTEKFALLFRATNGSSDKRKKVKYTTVVSSEDLDNFWIQYTEVVKTGMSGLKKKDKKKKQKAKKAKKQSDDA